MKNEASLLVTLPESVYGVKDILITPTNMISLGSITPIRCAAVLLSMLLCTSF